MDAAYTMAEQSVGGIWGENIRYGLIDATPMRQGRGRRASHPKGRRLEGRRGQERFEVVVRTVEVGLRSGSFSPEAARRQIHEADLGESIRITESREEAVAALAHYYGLGYYLWDANSEQSAPGAGLLRASFASRKELT